MNIPPYTEAEIDEMEILISNTYPTKVFPRYVAENFVIGVKIGGLYNPNLLDMMLKDLADSDVGKDRSDHANK